MNLGWRRQHATPHLLQSTASQYSACTRGGACSRPRLISVDSGHTSPPPVDSLAVLSMYSGQCAQHATPHLLQLIASQCSAHGIRCRAIAPLPWAGWQTAAVQGDFPDRSLGVYDVIVHALRASLFLLRGHRLRHTQGHMDPHGHNCLAPSSRSEA